MTTQITTPQGIASLVRLLENTVACRFDDDTPGDGFHPDIEAAGLRVLNACPHADPDALRTALGRFIRAAIDYHRLLTDPDPFDLAGTEEQRLRFAAARLDAGRRALCQIADPDNRLRRQAQHS